jgi:hypothetical protein
MTAFGGANSTTEATLINAAAAPLRALLERNATSLCASLVPDVAEKLVRPQTLGLTCEAAVQGVFAATAASEVAPARVSVEAANPHVMVAGQHAAVDVRFKESAVSGTGAIRTVLASESLRISLEEVGGKWLVAGPVALATIPGCRLPTPCQNDSRVLLFILGEPWMRVETEVPVPVAVKKAGGRELKEFKEGRTAVAQSGCLACHKIGANGNRGPGQNLTHIGSKLSTTQIEHALLDPRAPMPSFRNLPAKKLRTIVRFLSLLH